MAALWGADLWAGGRLFSVLLLGAATQNKPQDAKNRNGVPLRFFVGRTPGNVCCRCFLSDLTGLAVLPPSGLAKDLPVKGVNCQWSRWLFIASLPGASRADALLMITSISLSFSPPRFCSLCSSSTGS